ncbi:MAG: DUF364 domain-containing protein [Oscillospiraceae bacterium]
MTEEELFRTLREAFQTIAAQHQLQAEQVHIQSRTLSPEEAIGITVRKDFPILTGKEQMLQAEFMGSRGQAFTDAPAVFHGTLADALALDLMGDSHARGLFIATLNAVMCHLGLAEHTVHCKNGQPEDCALQAVAWVREHYGAPRIALVGYQPALLERLSEAFPLRVLDLNPDNVGQVRYGVTVEHGIDALREVVYDWAELVLCTGSTLCNGTIVNYLGLDKDVVFFGTTASGTAPILGLKRMCFCAE